MDNGSIPYCKRLWCLDIGLPMESLFHTFDYWLKNLGDIKEAQENQSKGSKLFLLYKVLRRHEATRLRTSFVR